MMRHPAALLATAILIAALPASGREPPPPGTATAATAAINRAFAGRLNLDDADDMADATRGRLAQIAEPIRNAKGEVVYDAAAYDFLNAPPPPTANPSLWRQSRLAAQHGLFEVVPGIYQIRGYDISVMTFIRGKTGWIVVDPLTSVETAAAGLALVQKTLGKRPITGIVFTHSHGDHYGGVAALASAQELASGRIAIVAPKHFAFEAVSENVLAGTYMGRRAVFQFGSSLPKGPAGQIGTGLGQALPAGGTQSFAMPTVEVGTDTPPMEIDGVKFEFLDAAQTEAPAELMFYLPDFRALCTAEVVTHNLHNVLTPRGAKVRDTLYWSKVIDAAIVRFGGRSDVAFASHHWPVWGQDKVNRLLTHHRDNYRFLHDQVIRLANRGETMHEIAEQIGEPAFAKRDLSTRGYYGTYNHNAKAVFQLYFGWWDGVPANYNAYPPVEIAKRYVAAMGGPAKALKTGIKAFDAGDYRWASSVFNHLVFADPADAEARRWLAASYEQQGYQAEAGTWRNIFLTAARELRDGPPAQNILRATSAFLNGIPTASLFDTLVARFDPAASKMPGSTVSFAFADRNEAVTVYVGDANAFPRVGQGLATATARIATTRKVFDRVVAGEVPLPQAIADGSFRIEGDGAALFGFLAALDPAGPPFSIVTP